MKKLIAYIMHNCFATYLPSSDSKTIGHTSKKIRGFLFKMFTNSDGDNINIQRKTIFSSRVKLGNNSGIGIGCIVTVPTILRNDGARGFNIYYKSPNKQCRYTYV